MQWLQRSVQLCSDRGRNRQNYSRVNYSHLNYSESTAADRPWLQLTTWCLLPIAAAVVQEERLDGLVYQKRHARSRDLSQ